MSKKGKRPALMLYTGDILKDEQLGQCSPATRGIWLDVLCHIHDGDRGELTGTVAGLARICRCNPDEMKAAVDELRDTNAGSVTERNGKITLVCRRMLREHKERKSGAGRQLRYRENQKTDESRDNNAIVTPPSSSSSSDAVSPSDKTPPNPPKSGGEQKDLFEGQAPSKKPLRDVSVWWNQLAGDHGLKTVAAWDADDDKKVRARLKQFGDPAWFESIETEVRILSDFAKGFVTIRWLYEPRNFKKIISGDFRDEDATKQATREAEENARRKKSVDDMNQWRNSSKDSLRDKYKSRLAMYRRDKDPWGKVKPVSAAILKALGESIE